MLPEKYKDIPAIFIASDLVREVGIREFIDKQQSSGEGWRKLVSIFNYIDVQVGEFVKAELDAFMAQMGRRQ